MSLQCLNHVIKENLLSMLKRLMFPVLLRSAFIMIPPSKHLIGSESGNGIWRWNHFEICESTSDILQISSPHQKWIDRIIKKRTLVSFRVQEFDIKKSLNWPLYLSVIVRLDSEKPNFFLWKLCILNRLFDSVNDVDLSYLPNIKFPRPRGEI